MMKMNVVEGRYGWCEEFQLKGIGTSDCKLSVLNRKPVSAVDWTVADAEAYVKKMFKGEMSCRREVYTCQYGGANLKVEFYWQFDNANVTHVTVMNTSNFKVLHNVDLPYAITESSKLIEAVEEMIAPTQITTDTAA